MCTTIAMHTAIKGVGKAGSGWFPVTQANVGFDHPAAAPADHALLLDFTNPAQGPSARVAVEMDLASGKALIAQIQAAIEAAEATGLKE